MQIPWFLLGAGVYSKGPVSDSFCQANRKSSGEDTWRNVAMFLINQVDFCEQVEQVTRDFQLFSAAHFLSSSQRNWRVLTSTPEPSFRGEHQETFMELYF